MPRIARIVGTGCPHHVIERGNNWESVFRDLTDYDKYLFFLSKYSRDKRKHGRGPKNTDGFATFGSGRSWHLNHPLLTLSKF